MTTNKPEVVGYRYTASKSRGKWYYQRHYPTSDNMAVTDRGECEALIRLSDYEALQAECEKLRKDSAAALSGLPDSLPMEPYQTVDRGSPHYKAGWNACRRAMLAALEKLIAAHHEAHRKQGGDQ